MRECLSAPYLPTTATAATATNTAVATANTTNTTAKVRAQHHPQLERHL
jgi:hypothetical protein